MARDRRPPRRAARPEERRTAPPPAWQPPARFVLVATVVAAILVHGDGVRGFFAADDLDFLSRARGLDPTPWGWARPLPGAWRWQLFTAWFGVRPLPHLLLAWLLHAASALLVARAVALAGLGRAAALAAGVLAAGTSVAWTSTHWASGLGEVMAAAFAAGTLVLHLECRRRHAPALAWLAGLCAVWAVASKESALLLPLAVVAFDRLVPVKGEGRGALREILGMGGLAGAAALVAWRWAPHVSGEAYALDPSPGAWLTNLLTYFAWLARLTDAVRDRSALADPKLVPWGLFVLAIWAFGVWLERRRPERPITAGLAWFVLLLAPVIPLARHTYLYYLVAPFAGVALALGTVLARSTARAGRFSPALLGLVLVQYVLAESARTRTRSTSMSGGILVDRVARESAVLRRTLADLEAAHVASGDSIALVNPWPIQSVDPSRGVVRPLGTSLGEHAYLPVVAALGGGRHMRLFRPDVTLLGIGDAIPREWERARVFRYDNDGSLVDLGRGCSALDSLASNYLRGERWQDARTSLERLMELGCDGPEVRWRLSIALVKQGDETGGLAQVRLLLERWPDSPRARFVRERSARMGSPGPPG